MTKYKSISSPETDIDIETFATEILMIKKYPDLVNVPKFWLGEYQREFLSIKSFIKVMSNNFPIHLIIDAIAKSQISDFEPSRLSGHIINKVELWQNKISNIVKRLAKTRKENEDIERESNLSIKKTVSPSSNVRIPKW